MIKKNVLALAVTAVLAIAALVGCSDRDAAVQSNYLLNTDSFDLATVVGLMRSGQATDAASLQTAINAPNAGINNVDIDHDGQVDMVMVRETAAGDRKAFEFDAVPSGNPSGEPVTVATAQFVPDNGGYVVNAGYPSYVQGYDQHYYHHSLGHDLLLAHYLMAPHVAYVPVYHTFGYHPYRVYAGPSLSTVRTTYRTTTRISPVTATARPASFLSGQSYRVPSRYQGSMYRAPATSTLSSRAGSVSGFRASNPSVNNRQGTGFWGRTSSSSGSSVRSNSTASPSVRSSGFSGFSRSRPSSGFGGFGSSRSSRPSSGFRSGGFGRRR